MADLLDVLTLDEGKDAVKTHTLDPSENTEIEVAITDACVSPTATSRARQACSTCFLLWLTSSRTPPAARPGAVRGPCRSYGGSSAGSARAILSWGMPRRGPSRPPPRH